VDDLFKLVTVLRGHHARLAPRERTDGYSHDVLEAIEYWCSLAERALAKDERLNYPQLADCEVLWVNKLEAALKGRTPQDIEEYQAVFQTASQVFGLLRGIPIPPNGYLGVLKVIRERFGFLQAEYGFRVEDEQPTGIKFCSDSVYVHLEHAKTSSLSCSFGCIREGSSFWVEDLLYLHGDERYRTIPYEVKLESEDDVVRWFGFIAEVLRTHGRELLLGDGSAFLRLEEAQKKRDDEYIQMMERSHGSSEPR
jgi:hypothetical protein